MCLSEALTHSSNDRIAARYSEERLRSGGTALEILWGQCAAWLPLAVISHQVLTVLNRLALPEQVLTARPKRLPFLLFHMPGRLVRHARSLLLRCVSSLLST